MIITRLQIQRQLRKSYSVQDSEEYTSVKDAVGKIYKRDGLRGFYPGLAQDTLKSAVDAFLFFLVYNSLRQARLKAHQAKHNLPALDELAVGFVAGASARFCTMPISTVVTRLQTTSMVSSRSSGARGETASVRQIMEQIRAEKGIEGFWSGYSATLVLTLNPSLTFFFFENLKRALPQSKRADPGPTIVFFLAALSKVLASTITYPFSLAKARTQASSKPAPILSEEKASSGSSEQTKQLPSHAASHAKSGAYRHTIVSTILDVIRSEGFRSLYEGLEGEVLKGFFSHGITILMKDAIHGLIIQLYSFCSKLLKRYPSAEELAQAAKERAKVALTRAEEKD